MSLKRSAGCGSLGRVSRARVGRRLHCLSAFALPAARHKRAPRLRPGMSELGAGIYSCQRPFASGTTTEKEADGVEKVAGGFVADPAARLPE